MLQTRVRYAIVGLFLLTVFTPRLLSLGSVLTVDEPLWQARGNTFLTAIATGQWDNTLVAGQPGITTAWLAGLAHRWQSLATSQAAIAVASGIIIVMLTYFLTILWGFRWGMTAGMLIALDPFLIAHSRVVHTDALLALLYTLSLLALIAGLEPTLKGKAPILRYMMFSAAAAALAVLTKLFALLLLPTIIVFGSYYQLRSSQSLKSSARLVAIWLGLFLIVLIAGWPALWQAPQEVYSYLFSRANIHAEGTRLLEASSQWWYYLREGFFRLTPIATILAAAALLPVRAAGAPAVKRVAILMLEAGIAFALGLSFSADKSDRYILFTLVTLTIFGVYGLRKLVTSLATALPATTGAITAGLVLALFAFLIIDNARLHPYYLAHYNRLYPIEDYHKMGWGEGLEQAAGWIKERNPAATVASYYPRVTEYFYGRPVQPSNHAEGSNINYLVLYRSMFERGPGAPETELTAKYLQTRMVTPEHIISLNGIPYVWIFVRQ